MLAALVAISLSNLLRLISCHSLLIDTVVINVYLLGKILSEFQILFSGEIPRSRIALSSGVTVGSPVLLAVKLPSSRAVPVHQHQLCREAVCLPPTPPTLRSSGRCNCPDLTQMWTCPKHILTCTHVISNQIRPFWFLLFNKCILFFSFFFPFRNLLQKLLFVAEKLIWTSGWKDMKLITVCQGLAYSKLCVEVE